jgi:hypothetical protein
MGSRKVNVILCTCEIDKQFILSGTKCRQLL